MKLTLTESELREAVALWAKHRTKLDYDDSTVHFYMEIEDDDTWFTADIEAFLK